MANINEFISNMAKAGGFARAAQYEVIITPPSATEFVNRVVDGQNIGVGRSRNDQFIRSNLLRLSDVSKQLTLQCQSVSLPAHDLQTQNRAYASEPGREMVQTHGYAGTIDCTFLLSNDLREKHYFEQWQNLAVDNYTHKANYYDDYIGSMEIYQMSTKAKRNVGPNRVPGPHAEIPNEKHAKFEEERTYGVRASEVYPKTVGAISYAASSANEIATLDVRFEFRQWYNIGTDNKFGTADSELRPF